MFNPEESLKHLKDLRLKVILMKGDEVKGLTPLEKKDEKSQTSVLAQQKQQEIN